MSIGPGFSKAKLKENEFGTGFVFQWDSGRIINKYADFNGTLGVNYFSKEITSDMKISLWQIPVEVGVRIYPFVTLDPFKEGEETNVHILAGSKESWSFCPYVGAGIGLLIGIAGDENTATSESNADGGLGFDLYFAAGIDLNLGQNFSLFTELKYQGNPGESTFKADDGSKYKVDMGTFLWKFGVRI